MEKLIHLLTLALKKFLMCSVDLNMGIIFGMTLIKIFSFSLGTGKYFSGNTLCNSDDWHATHSHVALFHSKQCPLHTPRKKDPEELNLENEWAREWIPLFLSNDQETLFRKARPQQHCPGTLYGVAAHVVTWYFPSLSDACPNASQICKLGTPD